MSRRQVMALLFGGRSVEHEVSRVSARTIAGAADPDRLELVPLLVDHDGRWYTGDVEALLDPEGDPTARERVHPPTDPAEQTLRGENGRPASPPLDVVFPIIHGTGGEDGRLQGLLETAGLAYVGAGVLSSSLCFDKMATKRALAEAGLPVGPWKPVEAADWRRAREAVLDRVAPLGAPVFVKPSNGGSSVGVSRAETREQIAAGLDLALDLDLRAVVEKGIDAREIECAVLGNDDPHCAAPAEIVPGRDFYDYEAKYGDAGSEVHVPASLEGDLADEARRVALAAYRALGVEGMARVDLLLERASGRYYVNEANTLPGFTAISVFPQAWAHEGVPLPALVNRLVALALERAERQRALRTRWRPGD